MRLLRQSSLEEYAKWYLERQWDRKGDLRPIPEQPEQGIEAMWERHCGKMRNWFDESSRWHIVELDAVDDLPNVVFLECPWTKASGLVIPEGPNYRLLRRASENALARNYLNSLSPDHPEHKHYYDALERGELQLVGGNRIAICSAEPSEMELNPDARYYLLDGVGRCLPYMTLLLELKMKPLPVEGVLAQRV
jgi:hypothetical protein